VPDWLQQNDGESAHYRLAVLPNLVIIRDDFVD